ncbi:MAG TPA: hypothetical protein VK861_07555 [Bacteroidales bacterium]|nr:hypothetical protein [Bacteroidales bacterium]
MAWYKIVAKLSHISFRINKKIYNFLEALLSGFWLGVMSEKSIEYSDELFYNATDHYVDDKYNESGLFRWEQAMIDKHFTQVRKILLIAAGGGRETLTLQRMGYEVDSYECNPRLIEYANTLLRKNGIEKKIEYLPGSSVPERITEYDGIIIGWGAYSLIPGTGKRLSFLEGLNPFLAKDAPLLISFLWTRNRGSNDKIIKSVANFFRILMRREKAEYGDRLVPDFIHYFTEEEIKKELTLAKYRITDYSSSDYGCIIAQKK